MGVGRAPNLQLRRDGYGNMKATLHRPSAGLQSLPSLSTFLQAIAIYLHKTLPFMSFLSISGLCCFCYCFRRTTFYADKSFMLFPDDVIRNESRNKPHKWIFVFASLIWSE